MSDLIDRQALKDYVSSLSTHPLNEWDTWGVIAAIDKQPTITAPRWHRVEEEPKEHMWCFVYTHDPEMIMPIRIAFYVASCTGKGSWYHYESGEDIDDEVDYWMPMYLEGPDIDKDLPWPIEPPKEDA
jgi:hypothetical protein